MRKNSKSLRKSSPKKKLLSKKIECSSCLKTKINPISIQSSLYNKHSACQKNYHHITLIDNLLDKKSSIISIH